MPKASRWKKIFGNYRKPTVKVQVGEKDEEMTDTQAFRFRELTQTATRDAPVMNGNPLEQSRYTLEQAAFRLMASEVDVLQRAASGSIGLYADVAGLEGRWRRLDRDGDTMESSLRALRSGYLGLTSHSCQELALTGGTNIYVFEFPDVSDLSVLDLDFETLQELSAWGSEKKCFCLREPRWLDRDSIVLLAPLVAGAQAKR